MSSSEPVVEVGRQFVAKAPLYMTMLDLNGRLIEMSPPFFETFIKGTNVSRAEVIDRNAADLSDECETTIDSIFERLAAGETIVELERWIVAGHGRFRLRSQASYWRDDMANPIAVLFVHQDVTAEVVARAETAEAAAQLRAVVDNIPAQISLMDVESGRVALMNARMRSGLGTYTEADVGDTYYEALDVRRRRTFEASVAQTDAAGGSTETECVVDHGGFAGRAMRVKHVLFSDAGGRRYLLWMAEDVTELRQATEGLKRAAADAAAANLAKSEFLANMSHEIRTPLNGVMGVAAALARTALVPSQREMVMLIESSAKTLATLLSDILDLTRIEAGKMEIQSEPFDLVESVNACGALFDAAAQAKGLDLRVVIQSNAPGVYVGDAARIRQILTNLLGNAVKFTSQGEVRLVVGALRGQGITTLSFEIQDTGIGFDAETKARLFSRFEQADGSITRRFGGSGLGLSISRSLAEAMGGQLDAEAEAGLGAVFTLTLTLPHGETEALDGEALVADLSDESAAGLRVLLAEDHPVNRRVVALILGASGVDLSCVENGAEAVQAFKESTYDLILMDMQMPVMDGLTAISEIRKMEAASGAEPIPIHVLTANAMPEHVEASRAAGADGHLFKPIAAEVLLKCIAQTVTAQRSSSTTQSIRVSA